MPLNTALTPEQRSKLLSKGIDPDKWEQANYYVQNKFGSLDSQAKINEVYAIGSDELYKGENGNSAIQDFMGGMYNGAVSLIESLATLPAQTRNVTEATIGDIIERVTGKDFDTEENRAKVTKGLDIFKLINPISSYKGFSKLAADKVITSDIFEKETRNIAEQIKYKGSEAAQIPIVIKGDNGWFEGANPNNITFTIGNGIGSMLGFVLSGKAVSTAMGGAKAIQAGEGAAGFIGKNLNNILGGYIYMNNEMYNEFRANPNISNEDAAQLAATIAIPVTLTEYFAINKLGNLFSKPAKKMAIKGAIDEAVTKYAATGITKEMYNDFSQTVVKGFGDRLANTLLKMGEGALVEGAEEGVQQGVQLAGQQIYDNITNSETFGTDITSKESVRDIVNNGFWGGVIGGLIGGGGGAFNNKVAEESVFKYIGDNQKNGKEYKNEVLRNLIKTKVEQGKLSPEQGQLGLKMVDEMVAIHKEAMPLMLKDIDARYQAYEFIQARNKIQADLLALDEKPVDPTLAKADSELRTIMEQSAEAYDEAIALIAKTKGQISESELGKKLFEIGTQFNKVEAPKEEVKTDITPIENKEELTTETKFEDKEDDIERRRAEVKNAIQKAGQGEGGQFIVTLLDGTKEGAVRISLLGNELGVGNKGVTVDLAAIKKVENLNGEVLYDADLEKIKEPKQEEVKVDLAKNDEMLKKAEKALKATITKIEQLKTQPLGAKESQAARDEKIVNFEERKKQIETKIGELNDIREAETRVEGIEETGAVVETADTGVGGEEVKVNPDEVVEEARVEPDVNNTQSGIEEAQIEENIPEQVQNEGASERVNDGVKPPKKSPKEKKVETDEEKNIKKDIASLEKKLSNAKGKKEASGIKKQIIERKKMLNAAQKGEAYVAEQKVNKDYKRGVPKAVKDFVAADTYGMALQYFGSGGRVSRQSFEDATGLFKTEAKERGAGRKIIKGNEEYDASRSMFSEKAPDYTDVANELTDYQGGEIYDEMVLAMEEVMRMRKADINAEIRRNVEKMQYGGLTKEQADKIEQEEIENAKAEQALINEYEDILAMEQEYLQSQQIGFNERDLNEKIAEAKKELRLSEQAYDERKAQLGRELANEQPALFEEVKEGMDRGDVNLSQENIDKILMPFKARVETAKRNLDKIDNEEQRNQAKDLDKRQTIIKFEQDIKNAAMEEGDIVDNMDENGDIKQDCQ